MDLLWVLSGCHSRSQQVHRPDYSGVALSQAQYLNAHPKTRMLIVDDKPREPIEIPQVPQILVANIDLIEIQLAEIRDGADVLEAGRRWRLP